MHELALSGQIVPELYYLARVAEWDPYTLHDLLQGHVAWVESVVYRSCRAPQNGGERQVRVYFCRSTYSSILLYTRR